MGKAIDIAPKLGSRALTSFVVWATSLLWTFCYSAGAGFGAFTYTCGGTSNPYGYVAECVLVYHPLFLPAVSPWQFVINLATLWFPGLYDSGLVVGFFITIALLAIASRMKATTVERVFSSSTAIAGGAALATIGYLYEVHQTFAMGHPHVPSL